MRARRIASLTIAVLVSASLTTIGAGAGPNPPEQVSASTPFVPVATMYEQSFDGTDGGFTTTGNASWQYGEPVSPPSTLPGQGPGMWGTALAGDYANSECGSIVSPAIDLSSVPGGADTDATSMAQLTFRHWMHVENRFDGGAVFGSSDGTSWKLLVPKGGYPNTPLTTARTCLGLETTDSFYTTLSTPAPAADAWKLAEFDVSAFLGGPLFLRWSFASDSSVVKRGWYVDDILVQTGFAAGATVPIPRPPKPGFTALAPVYAEDFEASEGGWTAEGGAWEWGEAVAPPLPQPGSSLLWGTRLGSDYLANECSSLTSPPIALPAVDSGQVAQLLQLRMAMWNNTESALDGAVLQVSVDDQPFGYVPTANYDRAITASTTRTCLGIASGVNAWSGPTTAPADDAWGAGIANLTRYAGRTVRLRVVFGSNASVQRRGLYIDDVAIELGAGPTVDPTEPPTTTAPGWTITGTNPTWAYSVPTTGPPSAQPVLATDPGGKYVPNECSAVVSPLVDTNAVTGLGPLTLRFSHFMRTASTDDGGIVQISADDGASWSTVTPVGGYNTNLGTSARGCVAPGATTQPGFAGSTGTDYGTREVSLSSFQGKSIRVRFIFGSGSSGEDLGWYVRSVQVTRGAVPMILVG